MTTCNPINVFYAVLTVLSVYSHMQAALPQLSAAQQEGNEDMAHIEVGNMRRAYVSTYKWVCFVVL